ncbi:MAG: hypothetical protein JXB30_01680 [Anaerolineae bacterium]|nr:hypothetical protein [Anaerolineae bacterium]
MQWTEIREAYPDQWLVIEALQAHTTPDKHRVLDKITVVDHADDGSTAMSIYHQLHKQYPNREFYFVHTGREELDIRVRQWLGIRRNDAVSSER